jgi:hypothetical protein
VNETHESKIDQSDVSPSLAAPIAPPVVEDKPDRKTPDYAKDTEEVTQEKSNMPSLLKTVNEAEANAEESKVPSPKPEESSPPVKEENTPVPQDDVGQDK